MSTIEWREAKDGKGQATREFRIQREGARDVTGAVWLPQKAREKPALACFGHGASGDRYQSPIPYLANRFASEEGVAALSIDGPVHGLRFVAPGGREALLPELMRPEALTDMTADWTLAVTAAQELEEIGAGELVYFGLSMGTIFGLPFTADRTDLVAAVLGLMGLTDGLPHMETLEAAAKRLSVPVRFLMQLEDELFTRESGLALFDALGAENKALRANPGLHPSVPYDELDLAYAFLAAQLNGAGPRRILDIIAD